MSEFRPVEIQHSLVDFLHAINSRVNKIRKCIDLDEPLNLEALNDIRVLTSKIELLDKKQKQKQAVA